MGVVPAIPVSDGLRSYTSLDRLDYADSYQVGLTGANHRNAEERLRGIFESPPAAARFGLRLGWRMLSLRLGPYPSARHVLGWPVEDSQPHRARLTMDGWLGVRANLLLHTEARTLTLASFVEYHRAGRVLWLLARPIHVRIVRWLLSQGVCKVDVRAAAVR